MPGTQESREGLQDPLNLFGKGGGGLTWAVHIDTATPKENSSHV